MAESNGQDRGTMPQRGKVAQVRQEWLVHEDGAMAYHEQSNEFQRHYGLNRYNRRTVREDIPVARVAQTEEEYRQQEERYQELQALRAQAEEDHEVARRIEQEILGEEEAQRRQRELEDEEMARKAFEKEQQRYEKYMEKKRLKDLKKERELLELQLQQDSQEAGLAARTSPPGRQMLDNQRSDVAARMSRQDVAEAYSHGREVRLNNGNVERQPRNYNARVTPAGRIEDDGDFSDFYPHLPEHVDEQQRKFIQETADEELAQLLQEQEHKRTKAEIDRNKLKEIEEQDARLAKIIQEQEKIRLKKAKQKKKKEQEEARKQQQVTNPATRPLPDLPGQRSSDTPVQRSHDHHRLRRDSFLQSLNNGPSENSSRQRNIESENSFHRHSSQNTQKSAKQPSVSHGGSSVDPRLISRGDITPSSVRNIERWLENSVLESQQSQSRGRIHSERSDLSDHIPSPSPPGSYHSDEEIPYRPPIQQQRSAPDTQEENHYAVSNPIPFNIAAAIDPTYQRRAHEFKDETEAKIPVSLASSLPVTDTELEWDPSLRGSLRRPKGTWNPVMTQRGYGDTGVSRSDSFTDEGPVLSPWQPVQGQKRSTVDKQKRVPTGSAKQKDKGSCKQQ